MFDADRGYANNVATRIILTIIHYIGITLGLSHILLHVI